MTKIVQAINAMISNAKLIASVIPNGSEYFFVYKGKYKWSISQNNGDHVLWFYPGKTDIETLANFEPHDFEDVSMIGYKDDDIGTREARASFLELYTIVKEKAYGLDAVLDDIISDASDF